MMQYMLLLTEPAEEFAERNDPVEAPGYWGAQSAFIGALAQAGVIVNGDGLHPLPSATTLRVRDAPVSSGDYSKRPRYSRWIANVR